jgi:hypothetical protein
MIRNCLNILARFSLVIRSKSHYFEKGCSSKIFYCGQPCFIIVSAAIAYTQLDYISDVGTPSMDVIFSYDERDHPQICLS